MSWNTWFHAYHIDAHHIDEWVGIVDVIHISHWWLSWNSQCDAYHIDEHHIDDWVGILKVMHITSYSNSFNYVHEMTDSHSSICVTWFIHPYVWLTHQYAVVIFIEGCILHYLPSIIPFVTKCFTKEHVEPPPMEVYDEDSACTCTKVYVLHFWY